MYVTSTANWRSLGKQRPMHSIKEPVFTTNKYKFNDLSAQKIKEFLTSRKIAFPSFVITIPPIGSINIWFEQNKKKLFFFIMPTMPSLLIILNCYMLHVDMHVMKDNMSLYVHKLCMLGLK